MLILAVDTATPVAGVALLDNNRLLKEEFSNFKKTHSETLMVMIDRVLRECESSIMDLSAIAVTIGPGSFTGLRIGLAAIKGLCMAANRPLIGVSTLDALAHNINGSGVLVCPLLDARKGEVYTAVYNVSGETPLKLSPAVACSPQDFVDTVLKISRDTGIERLALLGDAFYTYQDFLTNRLQNNIERVPSHLLLPRAAAVADLAVYKFKNGEYEDIHHLRPLYLRLSEAEYRSSKESQSDES